jgi:hypothetical protein
MNDKNKKNKKPVRVGRIAGYALLIIGCVSVIDFFSPIPIPTIGASALITGFLLITAGVFALIPDKKALALKFRGLFVSHSRPAPPPIDPLIPVRILKLARDHQGVLTVSTVAVGLNIPLETAETGLDVCVHSGQAAADFDMTREVKVYRFPEFLPPPVEEAGDE